MNQSKITVRYAKAFIALGKEKNFLPEFHQDAELVASVCSSSTDFILLLESPVIKTSQKINAIQKVFSGKVNDLTLKFLMLIAQNKREIYIPGIFRNFLDYYRKDQESDRQSLQAHNRSMTPSCPKSGKFLKKN
jgi:F-type H+-transporting ATPase subunit delta